MAQTPEQMAATMIANLEARTGRTLEQWLGMARAARSAHGFEKHGQIVKHLKSEEGLTHGYANLVAHELLQSAASTSGESGDALVEAQYAGAKAPLRPIYDAIISAVQELGGDIEIAPKKAYVSLRRSKQFAIVQPSTKTRVDVGVNLKDVAAEGRLEPSGSFNTMVSHRVRLESADAVDVELVEWLRRAYETA